MAWWLVVLVLIGYVFFRWYNERLPGLPGPWGVPILGYLPFVGTKMNKALTELGRMFGPVYQVQLGSRRVVVVCGQEGVRAAAEGFTAQDFAGRPDFRSYDGFGVFGAPGCPPSFKVYKKMTLKAFGLFANHRKEELERAAYGAFEILLEEMKLMKGEPFDPKPVLYSAVWTVMGFICYGKYFKREDPEVVEILRTADEFGRTAMFGAICDFLPWSAFLMRNQLAKNDRLLKIIQDKSDQLAAANVQSWDGHSLRNIADMYRKADEEMSAEEKSNLEMSDDALTKMLTNLFGAGFATVAVTLKWALLFMARHPDVQESVQKELDSVLGERLPTFADQKDLHFTNAVIAEVYRMSSMAALAITHQTIRDTELLGFRIPAETPVVFNLFSAHHDPSVFPDPRRFHPGRFLLPDGTLDKVKTELLMPYGLGPRRCGGEVLAKLQISLLFDCLMQRCRVDSPDQLHPDNYRFGLGLDPLPFKVAFSPRHNYW